MRYLQFTNRSCASRGWLAHSLTQSRSAFPMSALLSPPPIVFRLTRRVVSQTHNMNGPWPAGVALPQTLPAATTVTLLQLAHTCGLLGIINFFVLTAIRDLRSPALQEKVAASLLTPLVVTDISHILVTLYAIGDTRWRVDEWPSIVWITIATGLTLLIPRSVREDHHISGFQP